LQAIGDITADEIITVWQGTTTGDGGEITVNAGGDITSVATVLLRLLRMAMVAILPLMQGVIFTPMTFSRLAL
jgi:hypothetical protein